MKRFQHILAYLPPITNGENVIAWCRMIAKAAHAQKVDLITCVDNYLPAYPSSEGDESALESEKIRLTTLEKTFSTPTQSETIIEIGDSLKSVLQRLAEGTYDLVVLPVNNTESRLFAQKLARKSPVGVLAVPPTCPPKFHDILAAIDFSDMSELSISWAEAFASLAERETQIEALHVMKMPSDSRSTLSVPIDRLRNSIYRTSKRQLDELIENETQERGNWKQSIAEHPLASVEIVRAANEREVDLVVIGSHGRGALSIALLGGQTSEVIRTCERPVLIVKKKNETLGFLRQLIGLSQ